MTTREEYFQKLAYEMGKHAALSGMEKDAWIMPALRAGYGMLGKLLGKASAGLTKGLGSVGNKLVSAVKPYSPRTAKWMDIAGKGMSKDVMQFGMLGGGTGALLNPEDRWGGFQRGLLSGALGGVAWRGAGNIIRQGQRNVIGGMKGGQRFLKKHIDTPAFKPLKTEAGKLTNIGRASAKHTKAGKGWFTDPGRFWNRANPGAVKRIGAKAAFGTLPLAGAIGASMYVPTFEEEWAPERPGIAGAFPGPYGAYQMLQPHNNPYGGYY